MRDAGRLARFVSATAEPDRTVSLRADHAAVTEGRTLFPATVVGAFQSARFLISGDNSSKIGKVVEKGDWAGFPVFTLTLEERATCPRTCHQWSACFGNAMPWARRNDAFDPDFLAALKAEVVTLVRATCAAPLNRPKTVPPKGVVIRLHVLGDFFSVRYVTLWGELMRKLPELRVFGYTAHRVEDGADIAFALAEVSAEFGDRWMIRTSHETPGAARTIVVESDAAPVLARPDVILCPAQTKASEVCGTCALCWSPAAWGKTIAFLRHGMKVRASHQNSGGNHRAGGRGRSVTRNARGLTPVQETIFQALRRLADERGVVAVPVKTLLREAGAGHGNWASQIAALLASNCVQQLRKGGGKATPSIYRVFDAPQVDAAGAPAFPPPPPLPIPARKARAPIGTDGRPPRHDAAPAHDRAPDAPLVTRSQLEGLPVIRPKKIEAKYHSRTGALLNPHAIGSAERLAVGAPEDRIAALPETERERIARQYGAVIPKKAAAE